MQFKFHKEYLPIFETSYLIFMKYFLEHQQLLFYKQLSFITFLRLTVYSCDACFITCNVIMLVRTGNKYNLPIRVIVLRETRNKNNF